MDTFNKNTMKNFIFLCQQHIVNILSFFHRIPFTIRLKYLIWKYKGGENIPVHEINGMLLADEDDILFNTIETVNVVNDICKWLTLTNTDLMTYCLLGKFIRNEASGVKEYGKIIALIESKNKRKAVYDFMIQEGDIKASTINYSLEGLKVSQFLTWLAEE